MVRTWTARVFALVKAATEVAGRELARAVAALVAASAAVAASVAKDEHKTQRSRLAARPAEAAVTRLCFLCLRAVAAGVLATVPLARRGGPAAAAAAACKSAREVRLSLLAPSSRVVVRDSPTLVPFQGLAAAAAEAVEGFC
jgi:hypothetical protein